MRLHGKILHTYTHTIYREILGNGNERGRKGRIKREKERRNVP